MSDTPDVNDQPEEAAAVGGVDETTAPMTDGDVEGADPRAEHDDAIAEALDGVLMGDVDDDEDHAGDEAQAGDHDDDAVDDHAAVAAHAGDSEADAANAGASEDAAEGIEPVIPPPDDQLIAIVEALIFASPDPITLKALAKLLEPEPAERIEAAVGVLKTRYDEARGLTVVEVANGYQIVTRPELHEWVRRLFHERTTQKLSVAALETLAVIAYKQPVTAAEIAEIRSVNTSGVLGTLMDRKLIKIAGRKAVVGRPFMYATTREFLERFGLRDLNDLPKIEDMADVLGFDPPLLDDTAVATALPFDGGETDGATADGAEPDAAAPGIDEGTAPGPGADDDGSAGALEPRDDAPGGTGDDNA